MNLQQAYDRFQESRPPKGFGLIAEKTQMLIDLLDGDISGLVQQRLLGKDVKGDLEDWRKQAEELNESLDSCAAKLAESALHIKELNLLADKLEKDSLNS